MSKPRLTPGNAKILALPRFSTFGDHWDGIPLWDPDENTASQKMYKRIMRSPDGRNLWVFGVRSRLRSDVLYRPVVRVKAVYR